MIMDISFVAQISHNSSCFAVYSPNNRFAKSHGKYSEEDLKIELSHREPENFTDKSALFAVRCVRFFFDVGKCGGCIHFNFLYFFEDLKPFIPIILLFS